ncbi:MAG: hypothetical protein NVS4B3_16180 [Gemmatimonadaceae bacterium]
MAVDTMDGRRGIGALLRDLVEGSAALVRHEIRLARAELSALVSGVGRGTALVAAGAVFALLGALAFLVGFILLIGEQWLPDRLYWVAGLLVACIAGAVAYYCARRGATHLNPQQFAARETVATLKEDKEWLRQRLTSGATSS